MLKSFLNLLGDFDKSSGHKRNENLYNILPLQVLLQYFTYLVQKVWTCVQTF